MKALGGAAEASAAGGIQPAGCIQPAAYGKLLITKQQETTPTLVRIGRISQSMHSQYIRNRQTV